MKDLINNNMSFNDFKTAVHENNIELNNKIEQIWTDSPTSTVYTAIIDMEESDPDSAVSYANAAGSYEAEDQEWLNNELFKDIKPCLLNDGQVMCYLDPNDYSQQIKPSNYVPIFYRDDVIKTPSEKLYICQIEEPRNKAKTLTSVVWENKTVGEESFICAEQDWGNTVSRICYNGDSSIYYFKIDNKYYFACKNGGIQTEVIDGNPVRKQKFNVLLNQDQWVQQTGIGIYNSYTRDRGYSTTVCFKPHSNFMKNTYIKCDFSDIDTSKEYYFEMRFYAKAKSADGTLQADTRRMIDIDFGGSIGRKTFDLPKKGKELSSGGALENSQYEFQIMRIYLGILSEDSPVFKIYKTDGETVGAPEIDYVALRSVDSLNIENLYEDVVILSPQFTASSPDLRQTDKFTYIVNDITSQGESNHTIYIKDNIYSIPNLTKCTVKDYPYLKVFYRYKKQNNSNNTDGKVNLFMPYKDIDGTMKTARLWGVNATYQNSDSNTSFIVNIGKEKWTGGDHPLEDIDFENSPLQGFLLKPWYDQTRTVGDYCSILGIALFKDEETANNFTYDSLLNLSGEVMIEIPKMGYKFENINNTQRVSVTRKSNYSDFCYNAFKRGDKYNDYIYISAYDATKLKSEDGKYLEDRVHSLNRVQNKINNYALITADDIIPDVKLREWTGLSKDWSILTYHAYTLLGCLNLLYSKSIKGNEENYINPFGILFANSSNLYSLEGCKITGTSSDERDRYYIYQAFENFSDNASWEQIATIADEFYPSVSIGIPQKIMATNTLGFFPKEFGGSTSTYYGVTTYNMHWWQGLLTTSQAKKFGLTGRAGPTQHGDGNKMYCHIMYSQA